MDLSAERIAGLRAGDLPASVVIAAEAVFVLMDGHNLVFSEAGQELYELNELAAYIWCRLGEGDAPAKVAEGLALHGVAPDAARGYIGDVLSDWCRLGLVVQEPGARALAPTPS